MIRPHVSRWLLIFFVAFVFCCAGRTATAQTWEPISTGFATDILISPSGNNTSAEVTFTFSNSGYRVIDWGQVTVNNRDFSVNAKVERWTGVSAQFIMPLKHIYALGALGPGTYSFTVKIYGSVAKTVQFSVGTTAPLPPRLLTDENTGRAIALESMTLLREPFSLTPSQFSLDRRTHVILFATDIELAQGEDFSTVTAQAEDSQQGIHPLTVEYVGKVPTLSWLTEVIVTLPAELDGAGDVGVTISVRGTVSNKVVISIKRSGSSFP